MDESKQWPSVSVLIATRDRPQELQRSVASVLAGDYPHFEIIVIDQGRVPPLLPSDRRLRVVRSSSRVAGKSRALNEAIALATGSILAFTDDDCTVAADWLESGTSLLLNEPDVGLVFGKVTAIPHDPDELFVPSFLPTERLVLKGVSSAHIRGGGGGNMFVRRHVMDEIRGFDPLLGPGMIFKACEEYDVFYRTLRAGFGVARDPNTVVVHWGGRPMADGSGPQLLRDYFFGEGVVLGKHSRVGDRHAAWLALKIFAQELNWACRGALRGRFAGARRTASWTRGFIRGFERAIDPATRLFRERVPNGTGTYSGHDRRRRPSELQHS